jgi:hypothetical protein
MRLRGLVAGILTLSMMAGAVAAPIAGGAQAWRARAAHHRQKTKNNWRNAAIGSGAVGVLGLATGHPALGVVGLGGAAYAGSRYEHDRKSQSRINRRRAAYHRRHYRRYHHS